MKTFIKTIGSYIAGFAVLAVAFSSFPTASFAGEIVNCSGVPSVATFNPFPVNYSLTNTEACKDFPAINATRNTDPYPNSESAWRAGTTAHQGDQVEVLLYIHNGARTDGDTNLTTAKNVVMAVNMDTNLGTQHSITSRYTASNASAYTSSFTIKTNSDERLEFVPNSGILINGANQVLQSGINLSNTQSYTLGDMLACFEHVRFLSFKVRVVKDTVVTQNPNLTINKEVSLDGSNWQKNVTAKQNDTVKYRITVTNNGQGAAQNVFVKDDVINSTGFSAYGLQTSISSTGGQLTAGGLSFGTLNPGSSFTVMYSATVTKSSGTYTNTATTWADNNGSVTSSANVTVQVQDTAQVYCQTQNTQINVNGYASFTATGGNGSYSWSAPDGNPTSGNGSSFSTMYSSVGYKTVTVTSGGKTNTCAVNVVQNSVTSVSINKTVKNTTQSTSYQESVSAKSGDRVTFQIVATNTGNAAVNNFIVEDTVPAGLTFDYNSLFTSRSGSKTQYNDGFAINFGSMGAGESVTITFDSTVNSNSSSTLTNTANVRADNVNRIYDTAQVTISFTGTPNITLSKSAWNDTLNLNAISQAARRGDRITYTLKATNNGSATQDNFVVQDDLVGVLPFATIVQYNGGVLYGNSISFPGVSLAAGQSITRTFQIVVKETLNADQSFQLVNTYGNSVTITINGAKIWVAPRTGVESIPLVAYPGFAGLAYVAFKNRARILKAVFTQD